MSKKIVILGALGYLGTELCKIYSGESWYNKVIAIDSRFVSERVNQLGKWNIEFIQGHILDKEFLKNNLNDADTQTYRDRSALVSNHIVYIDCRGIESN